MLSSSLYIKKIIKKKEQAKGVITVIKNIIRSTLIVGVLCGVVAVSVIGQSANAQAPVTAMEESIVTDNLETGANYEIKEGKVIINFGLTNHSTRTNKLQFSSGQQYEVVITDDKGEEVYKYSEGKFFTQALLYKDLQPGQSLQWQDVWDMTDKDGKLLTSGYYRAEITILAGMRDTAEKIDHSRLTTEIEFNLLELAANQFMPQDARYIIPPGPEGMKNFLETDLNNDANPEIAVFYQDRNNAGVILLEQNKTAWKLKDQIACSADNLEYAGFLDLDGDKLPEMLLGVKGDAQHNQLRIYRLQDDKYTLLDKIDYDRFSAGDLDNDGNLEIASLLRTDKKIPNVKLQVHSLFGKAYQVEHERDFEDGSYHDNVVIGAVKKDQQGIFVDLGIGAHSGLTEIIIKENGKYQSALASATGDELPPTFKPYPLISQDINNDGIIEVGIQAMPPGTDHLPMVAIPWINNWYQWNGKDGLLSEPVLQEYSNYGEDYRFVIPDNWAGKFTIENKTAETSDLASVHFIYLASDNLQAQLLALHLIPKADWTQQEQEFRNNNRSYVLLGENSKNILAAELPQDNGKLTGESLKEYQKMLLNETSVKRSFRAIKNETHMLYNEKGILKPEYAKPLIKETADKLLYALSVNDAESISADVHPAKGLRFTPYTYVSLKDDVVFNASEVKNFFNDQKHYLWGHYDGTGDDIFLTPGEYFDRFVYPVDYLNAEEIGYNEVLSFGNMLENQFEVYENAIVVEYYFSGFNPAYAGLDWRSLRLVFQEYEGSWKLVGLINNQWTI